MFANVINYLSSKTALTRQMVDEITEFRTLKKEINKARCVMEFSANGSITFVNENTLKSLGYSESELLNEHHRMLVDREESGSSKYEIFWENLAAGITQTGQFKLKDKKGAVVWFQGYYAPVINAAHKLVKVVCYFTDITADKAKALVLQGGDEALNQTFGIMECDMSANIIGCNELFIKPLGYIKEEVIGKNAVSYTHLDVYKRQVLTEGDDQQDPIADAARAILDGHIVLSRSLAESGHYPAIDIEQSISRAMHNITSPEHLKLSLKLKQLNARYTRSIDLINVGAYEAGSDELLDEAIAKHDQIKAFLQQDIQERADVMQSIQQLAGVLYS